MLDRMNSEKAGVESCNQCDQTRKNNRLDDNRRSHIFFAERPSSGIAGWRGGLIAGIGSEGTRPALLPAGPVPERLITVAVARKW